jgi:hypothetical protein
MNRHRRGIRLDRRTFLRGAGVAGLAIALPELEAMFDARARDARGARAQVDPGPKRLFLLHWPQGVPGGWDGGSFFTPAEVGDNWTMTPGLEPLARHKPDINLVSGLTYDALMPGDIGDPHGHAIALFTGHPTIRRDGALAAQGVSVENIAAGVLGAGRKFQKLGVGIYSDEGWWSWTAASPGAPPQKDPLELDPVALFDSLFGDLGANSSVSQAAALRARSILDFVQDDITGLQRELGAADRLRLDEHLASVRALEQQLTTSVAVGAECAPGARPPAVAYDNSQAQAYARLMMDLCVMALRCDLTRVVLLSLGPSANYRTFPFLEVNGQPLGTDYHNVCHEGFNDSASVGPRLDDRASALEYYQLIARWHMDQVAYLLDGLKASSSGAPALLDSSVFLALSEFNDGGMHYHNYLPVIAAGKVNGMATGKNLGFPTQFAEDWMTPAWARTLPGKKNVCVNDLWQAVLQALDVYTAGEVFGAPGIGTSALPGLWV